MCNDTVVSSAGSVLSDECEQLPWQKLHTNLEYSTLLQVVWVGTPTIEYVMVIPAAHT